MDFIKQLYKTTTWKWWQLKIVGASYLALGLHLGWRFNESLDDMTILTILFSVWVLGIGYTMYNYFRQ